MNRNAQVMKDAIIDYRGKAEAAMARIKQGHAVYRPEAARSEEKRIRAELGAAREAAERAIQGACREAVGDVKRWATLDGSRLTDDAKLLETGLDPEQFRALTERYRDNYTMLNALRNWGEAQNAAAVKQAAARGEWTFAGPYDTRSIPDPQQRVDAWERAGRAAVDHLNAIDGTGRYADPFTRTMVRAGLDGALERFGEGLE